MLLMIHCSFLTVMTSRLAETTTEPIERGAMHRERGGTETGYLMPDTRTLGQECLAGSKDDAHGAAPLQLSHRIARTGEVVVDFRGELDIATAEAAVTYVRNVIDRYRGSVIADLAALAFCDASGLGALLRMAYHAERAGCAFRLACPSPSLIKVMRITRLDRRFLMLHRPPA